MSSSDVDDVRNLKNEISQLRRTIFAERDKSLEERLKRLRLESWFRDHLHQCRSKVGEVPVEVVYSDVAVQTEPPLLNDEELWFSPMRNIEIGQHSYISYPSTSNIETYRSSSKEEFPLRKTPSNKLFTYFTKTCSNSRDSVLSATNHDPIGSMAHGKGLYFIDMDGVINCSLDVNPKAIDRMETFVKRSMARQRRIKDASVIRKQIALEKRNVVSKLISGEVRAEEAIPLFERLPVSAFPIGRIIGETKARFQNTSEYRRNQAAQMDTTRRKWNRLHALCFSEALRLRSAADEFCCECSTRSTLSRHLPKSLISARK